MSASMMAAALPQISRDLGIDISTTQLSFSIYVLGLGFAPIIIAAMSEMYGRKPVWLACNAWYVLWNALCPVGMSHGLLIAGRFLAGSGAGVGNTLTGPIMADMYRAKDRGRSQALAGLLPYLGPALGPIVGGVVSQNVSWPWLFWVLSMFDAAVLLIGLFVLRETYTPVLLRRKARTENPRRGQSEASWRDLLARIRTHLYQPLELLIKRPVIQYLAFNMSLNFGIYFLNLSTFATLWIERYGMSETSASLNYLAIALGFTIGGQTGGPLMDYIWRRMRDRPNSQVSPEFRAPYMAIGAVFVPVGLLWYGWSVEKGLPWPMVDAGAVVFTIGISEMGGGFSAYLFDEFDHNAASANAATRMLSNIFAFVFPIFAPQMYVNLGYGWGNSLLVLIFIVFGLPAPFIFWFWGKRLRAMGKKQQA